MLSELNNVEIFEIRPRFPKLWALEIFVILKIWLKNYWNFTVSTSTDHNSYISEYFHSVFCNKVQGSMLNKTRQCSFLLVTFEPWSSLR